MSGKPKLHYFNGRGRMEPIRWLLAAAGVEVCLCFLILRVWDKHVLKDHGQDFLVGNQLSRADVQLLDTILMAEEFRPDILAKFPLLQRFKARISNIPTIKKFLQPGSQRKPPTPEEDIPKVLAIFY
ncbi:glutathione S-transferase A4-like [Empidonax traillii]|uniref:glutathione S-transferase A4-like n=1 Tax=Empidonax traillii TaxID=164674 RepID=UPI000FFD666F|nr:glutathione S-transferase A4-like [Empidonax traillii]